MGSKNWPRKLKCSKFWHTATVLWHGNHDICLFIQIHILGGADKQEGAGRSKYYAPQLWTTCVTREQWIWETNYRNIMVTEHVPKSYMFVHFLLNVCSMKDSKPHMASEPSCTVHKERWQTLNLLQELIGTFMCRSYKQERIFASRNSLEKLFHLLEKILMCNNDTHCISKGKIGHIRAWNSRVIQL